MLCLYTYYILCLHEQVSHPNIVTLKKVVTGRKADRCVMVCERMKMCVTVCMCIAYVRNCICSSAYSPVCYTQPNTPSPFRIL